MTSFYRGRYRLPVTTILLWSMDTFCLTTMFSCMHVAQLVGVFLNFTAENNDETRQDVKEKLAFLETTFCVHLLTPFNLFRSV